MAHFLFRWAPGKDSSLTGVSHRVLEICKSELASNEEHLAQLEKDIALARENALEAAETESLTAAPNTPSSQMANEDSMTGGSGGGRGWGTVVDAMKERLLALQS